MERARRSIMLFDGTSPAPDVIYYTYQPRRADIELRKSDKGFKYRAVAHACMSCRRNREEKSSKACSSSTGPSEC